MTPPSQQQPTSDITFDEIPVDISNRQSGDATLPVEQVADVIHVVSKAYPHEEL